MSDSQNVSVEATASLSPGSPGILESAEQPERTLERLNEVLELSEDEAAFQNAFVDFSRKLTGARAGVLYREQTGQLHPIAVATVSGLTSVVASRPEVGEVAVQAYQENGSRRAPVSLDGVSHVALCIATEPREGERFVLLLLLGPERAPFVGPIFTIQHLLARFFAERERMEELESLRSGFLQATLLVDVFSKASLAPSFREAVAIVGSEIRHFFQCDRVAIGAGRGTGFRIESLSGFAKVESRSHGNRLLKGAMTESLGVGKAIGWPVPEDLGTEVWPSTDQGELLGSFSMEQMLVVPLVSGEGEEVGAWMFFWKNREELTARKHELIEAATPHVASLVGMLRQSKPRGIRGAIRQFRNTASRFKKAALLSILAIVVIGMLLPFPYRIRANCEVQALKLRQVAAPFEGTLDEIAVKPGQRVTAEQVLARLDGKELSSRLAQAVAEKEIALKKRDQAQAGEGDIAAAQMAQHEADSADAEIALLQYRKENLEIRAPIDGYILSGDLDQSQGVPVTMGQKLFDVAPIETMRLEIAVPDSEIRRVSPGMIVEIRLEAQPRKKYEAVVDEIYPVSEVVDSENVFICLAVLENPNRELRPGMRGMARLISERRSLGWILFHKPWEWLRLRF